MLRQTVQSVTISRLSVKKKVLPEKSSAYGAYDEKQRATTTTLDSVEINTSGENSNKNNLISTEKGEEIIEGHNQNTELSNEKEKEKEEEKEKDKEKLDGIEAVYDISVRGLDEMKNSAELSSPSPLEPLQHLISVALQDAIEANARPDSSTGPSSEESRKTVRCSALLVSADKVILPSNLLRAALVTRVLICKDNRAESSSVQAADDVVAAKSR